jgi:Protein of unknown function (DUF1579)
MRQTLRRTVTILIGLTWTVPALAQSPPPAPCTGPEHHQLDFWVGEWDLTWPGQGNNPAGTATNRIEKILDGCAVQENFTGTSGPRPLLGRSLSTYSAREKVWKQTWVDSQGAYLDFTGEFKDGEMRLSRHATGPAGKPRLARMVFTNIKPDSFDWRWEFSADDGKTWSVAWPIHYQRKGTPKR